VEAQALAAPAPVSGMSLPRGFKARSYVRITPPTVRLCLPFNRRYENVRPQGTALWLEPSEVRESVLCAREHEVPVVIRSGGHNCAGYSTTEGLLIDRG
jgi:FAD/FMN-containing dehydrogenase